jgi:hypothetical protein
MVTAALDYTIHSPARFWMRAVPFTALRNLLALTAQVKTGLSAGEMVEIAKKTPVLFVRGRKGGLKPPSITTVYHYRNTLLHLGALIRSTRDRMLVHTTDELVSSLAQRPADSQSGVLTPAEKAAFAELVLRQQDCRDLFVALFTGTPCDPCSLEAWRATAREVSWTETGEAGHREILMQNPVAGVGGLLRTANQIQALLYGLRYWFRDELDLIDEVYREDKGNLMFPILPHPSVSDIMLLAELLEHAASDTEWTRIGVRELALRICVRLRIPLARLHAFLLRLKQLDPGHIAFIPTSRSFAAITARSNARENLELRSYLRDSSGVYVSHLRFHRDLRETVL